jgi:hypothetical protein
VVASPLPPKPNDIPGMLHVLSPFDDGDERYHRPTVVLFTEVRGIVILRTSPFGDSRKSR